MKVLWEMQEYFWKCLKRSLTVSSRICPPRFWSSRSASVCYRWCVERLLMQLWNWEQGGLCEGHRLTSLQDERAGKVGLKGEVILQCSLLHVIIVINHYAHNLRRLLLFIANIGVVVHLCTFSSSPLSSSSSSQFCLSFLSVKLHNCLSRDRQLYASCQVGPMRKHRLQESVQTDGQAWNASSYRPTRYNL